MREHELIRWIRDRADTRPDVLTGIGDDAAVLDGPAGGTIVVTTDLLVEGTHFLPDDDPFSVGWKALAVSVSDVAAMGCRSRAAVLAVSFPRDRGDEYAERVLEGACALARTVEAPLVGGDTTETRGPVVLCSTLIGDPLPGHEPVLRSGAHPGQAVLVTGSLGGSLAGRHLRFEPRQKEALELVSRAAVGGMIDLSDGLSTDAWHLARESEVGLRIRADAVPVTEAARSATDGRSPLEHALADGEDFELLFTVAAEDAAGIVEQGLAGTAVSWIGEVVEGPAQVTLVGPDDGETRLDEAGYEHFR